MAWEFRLRSHALKRGWKVAIVAAENRVVNVWGVVRDKVETAQIRADQRNEGLPPRYARFEFCATARARYNPGMSWSRRIYDFMCGAPPRNANCSFCGLSHDVAGPFAEGANVSLICQYCVERCGTLLHQEIRRREGLPPSATIRITSAPPGGNAPLEVRQGWIGAILPVESGLPHEKRLQRMTIDGTLVDCYIVRAIAALDILADHNPAAADWWKANEQELYNRERPAVLAFSVDCCQYLDVDPPT